MCGLQERVVLLVKRQKVDGKHHSDVPPKCTKEATSQPL